MLLRESTSARRFGGCKGDGGHIIAGIGKWNNRSTAEKIVSAIPLACYSPARPSRSLPVTLTHRGSPSDRPRHGHALPRWSLDCEPHDTEPHDTVCDDPQVPN